MRSLLGLSFILPLVAGHTTFTTLYVDGVSQGDGICVRMNRDVETATFPIEPLSNAAMACGYDGEQSVSRVCPVEATSTLTFEFRAIPDDPWGGSIDPSHKGPCAVYMKHVDDATASNNAAGDGWFKIYEMDYDTTDGKWCTEKLIANNGLLSAQIPSDIKSGYYLVRPELLALQSAQDSPPDPQFYVGCAQVYVTGGGNASPETVSIGEGTYDLSIPAMTYNIFEEPLELPFPKFGPAVYQPGAETTSKAPVASVAETTASASTAVASVNMKATTSSSSVQIKGLKPAGCILERDDWCGFEVPAYSTEDGCWASSKKCWDQSDVCWHTALPTGNKNCQIWQDKCTNIDENCSSGNWNGPPNMGMDLTPTTAKLAGSVMRVFSGGISSASKLRSRHWSKINGRHHA